MALTITKGSGVRCDSRGDRFRARILRCWPRGFPGIPIPIGAGTAWFAPCLV